MFENKKRTEERKNLIEKMQGKKEKDKKSMIIEDFKNEIENVSHNIEIWGKLKTNTMILMHEKLDKVTGTNVESDKISIVYADKDDVPADIFCEAQKLGLIATCQRNDYFSFDNCGTTSTNYQIDLEQL